MRPSMLTWKNKSRLFEEAAMPHVDAVFRFALYLAGNEPDAEDLTQDCFYQAYRSFHQFRRGSNCRAWLFRIARNCHIDRLRRSRHEPMTADLETVEGGTTPQDAFERRDPLEHLETWQAMAIDGEDVFYDMFGDEVNRILGEIPREFRVALVLCDVEGFNYQEIAEILGCPVGTVRSRISRGRSHLRERLYRYAKELGYVKTPED